MTVDVQVRALRLGGSKEAARHVVPRLEDAFRIASLPCAPPCAAIFVRSLDLGLLPRQVSSVALAGHIDRVLLGMSVRPLRIAGGGHADSTLVWFDDPIEVAVQLAAILARGHTPTEWYWKAAFPACFRAPTRAAALREILASVRAGDGGLLAVVAYLDRLLHAGVLGTVVDAVLTEDTADLVPGGQATLKDIQAGAGRAQACRSARNRSSHLVEARKSSSMAMLRQDWRQFLCATSARWLHADSRAAALCSVALLASRPALLYSPRFPDLAQSLLMALTPGQGDTSPPSAVARPPLTPGSEVPPAGRVSAASRAANTHRRNAPTPGGVHGAPTSVSQTPLGRSTSFGLPEPVAPGGPASSTDPIHESSGAPRADGWTPECSEHGGFPFLIPLLRHLGLEQCLGAYPWLAESDFPVRLFHRAVRHLSVPANDPVLLLLPENPGRADACEAWVAPEAWLDWLWTGANPVASLGRRAGGYRLAVRQGRLPVAQWPCRGRPELGAWGRCRPIRRHLCSGASPCQVDALEDAWILAAAAFLRRHRGPTLRALLRRPGIVEATPTHLDVTFPQDIVDIGVRRLGLDLNPGWVPWLGRVINFHYDDRSP